MKHTTYLFAIITLLTIASCVDLDRDISTDLSESQVINSYDFTLNRVSSLYTEVTSGYSRLDGAMAASASDEAEHTLETSTIHSYNNGSWNAVSNPENIWASSYKGIRKVNQFLLAADSVDLDRYRLDPTPSAQAVFTTRKADVKRWKYEARFLRAYFYSELIKRYGGVPLVNTVLRTDDDFRSIKRNTLQDCINFIVTECDSAAANLPAKYPVAELGRATKVAALSLKSRVLLYAASDLFNTTSWASGYAHPEFISLSGNRNERWKAAAAAAKAVTTITGAGVALHNSYPVLFITNSYITPEIIFARREGSSNTFEKASYPVGYDLGQSGTTPSQNLVDAYEMLDGTKFDWKNPDHAANPYDNRDPRLTYSVLTNNTFFKNRNVECFTGGKDGNGRVNATRTGYYLKKYVNENLDLLLNTTSVKSWNIIRFAEMYLNYAEALNEYDPGNIDIIKNINFIRTRAGVKMPEVPQGLSQAEVRERIQHERRVEFAFEDHRRWDARRWLKGPEILGAPLMGVEITKNNGVFTYKPIKVEDRVFSPKMYLYPIPQGEINVAPGLVQNPLW
jgi:hypothetical protein